MRQLTPSFSAGTFVLAATLAVGLAAAPQSTPATQQPTFRSATDVVALEVQVVDNNGQPVIGLTPKDFDVSIGGRRHRVVSVDYIQNTTAERTVSMSRPSPQAVAASNIWPTVVPSVGSRVYILAFDIGSLTLSDSRAVVTSSLAFVDRLLPTDRVGVYSFPVGGRLEPTLDRAAVKAKINAVVGSRQPVLGEYNLTSTEIIDINAESARQAAALAGRGTAVGALQASEQPETLTRVQLRECGAIDTSCAESIKQEALSTAFYLEGRAREGLDGLRALIRLLSTQEGRKTVVMFSSGIVASDRPGGRPDPGDLAKLLGQDAASTNTTIYTLHIDTNDFQAVMAQTRRTDRRPSVNKGRENAVQSRLLEEFSGASGGAMMRVLTGAGEYALDRVLRETSSVYLVGVDPTTDDRDGKLKSMNVKVGRSGVTVRSRNWVVIPKSAL